MRSKIISLMLISALTVTIITGCGNSAADTSTEPTNIAQAETHTSNQPVKDAVASTDEVVTDPVSSAVYDEFIASLHAGQSYAYAPICEGEDALLVTSYVFDDLEGHEATYEATIYMEKEGSVEKVTTVQSGGTAYPISVTDDNSLILSTRNSAFKGYVNKETGKFVITEEATVNYVEAEEGLYHNYKDGTTDISKDASLFEELSDKYFNSEVLSFQSAGVASDGAPHLAGAVYAAYSGDDLYNITSYYVFDSKTSGSTETPDGLSGLPFTYEQSGEDIVFHFASADDKTEAKFACENASFPTITFTGDNGSEAETITLTCLGNADPSSFEAAKYYDNDNNLYMQIKSMDETSLTGNLMRQEKIKAEIVENAKEGDLIYSVNGTQFKVVSFEDVNKAISYSTDEEFKKDVVGTTRFDKFLVKCSEDDFYYALEKEEYELEYKVVSMMTDEKLGKLIEENMTFSIKENCEIILLKYVENDTDGNIEQEYIIGREFKGDNYPGWSEGAKEYYLSTNMLVAISVVDGELYNVNQVYVP
ncbi:MAG: hypothetical protein K6F75_05240 [Butyrivibrio sp.]|nr:hypothetical protein [Butyrivibrio sp.]